MMGGGKRLGLSDSNSESTFPNKRKMIGSSIFGHREEPSKEQTTATPALDKQRAESSRQHVRALNTQFASWVQTQLKDHPDEIWEDGIQDYLAHASNIMEKFSDVVNWLKVIARKLETVVTPGSQTSEESKKALPSTDNVKNKFLPTNPFSFGATATTNSTGPWSAGVFSNSESSPGVYSNNHSYTGVLSTSKTTGASSNGNSSPGVPNSSPVFSPTQSTSMFSSSQSSGMFSNTQNSSVFSNSQSSSMFSDTQNSSVLPNTQSSSLFSSSQSSVMFSNSQSPFQFSNSQSSGVSSDSQGPGLFSSNQSPAFFSTSQSFGGFSNNAPTFGLTPKSQSSPLFGSQNFVPQNPAASNEADADDDEKQPGSPSVKKTEEKGVVVVHEVKCKLYVKSSDPAENWKDKGTGQLTIRCKEGISKGSKDSKPTVIVRNDVGKLLLNALLYSGIKTNLQKNSLVTIFHTAGEGDGNGDGDGDGDGDGKQDSVVTQTFLIRTRTQDDRDRLATAIQEYAPSESQ